MANNTSCRINTIEMLYASWRSGGFGGWPAHLKMKLRKRKVFRIKLCIEMIFNVGVVDLTLKGQIQNSFNPFSGILTEANEVCLPNPSSVTLSAISVLVTVNGQRINCALKYLSLELRRLCLTLFRSGAIIVPISVAFPLFWLFDSLLEPFDSKFAE